MQEAKIYDIVIIGAGAAGLIAAIAAKTKSPSCDLVVLEKNLFPAKKIYATGNGKCNFLNRTATPKDYFSRENTEYVSKVLASVFYTMPPSRVEEEFRRMGIIAVEEDGGRLYPRSMQAKSIADALCKDLQLRNVQLICNSCVKSCTKQENVFCTVVQDGKEYKSRKVIITTGGKAGCQYGSEGEGYALAKSFGHKVIKPIPALTQLITKESVQELFGVRARAELSLWQDREGIRKLVADDKGEVQFTKEGISGICTFNISRFLQLEEGISYELQIDLFAEYQEQDLLEIFLERRVNLLEREAGAILYGLLPDKLADALLKRTNIDSNGKVKGINRKALDKLAQTCKAFSFTPVSTKSWKDAQVTSGGVVLSEVDPKTLESNLERGLFFAGELLDVDGPCGGYNLGWAFASGYMAGLSAANR